MTLPSDSVERARRLSGPQGLSSYIQAALQEKLDRDERRDAFLSLIDDLAASDPIPPEVKHRGATRSQWLRSHVER